MRPYWSILIVDFYKSWNLFCKEKRMKLLGSFSEINLKNRSLKQKSPFVLNASHCCLGETTETPFFFLGKHVCFFLSNWFEMYYNISTNFSTLSLPNRMASKLHVKGPFVNSVTKSWFVKISALWWRGIAGTNNELQRQNEDNDEGRMCSIEGQKVQGPRPWER